MNAATAAQATTMKIIAAIVAVLIPLLPPLTPVELTVHGSGSYGSGTSLGQSSG